MTSNRTDEPAGRAWAAVALAVLLFLASLRWVLGQASHGTLLVDASSLLYQSTNLSFNYVEFGAIRRGLAGTLLYGLGLDARVATLVFHTVSAAAFSVAAALVYRRIRGPGWLRAAYAVVAMALALRWAENAIGFTDLAIAALAAFATLAMASRRQVLACLLISLGLFMHESSLIFGLPLLLALLLSTGSTDLPPGTRWRAAAVVTATLAVYLALGALPHVDAATMADAVRAKFPSHRYVDWAVYFAVGGLRGVRTSVCQNATDPNFWLHLATGCALLALLVAAFGRTLPGGWRWLALASLPSYLFLAAVANDNARWITLACFNIWLVAAAAPVHGPRTRRSAWPTLLSAVALLVLTHPKASRSTTPMFEASPLLELVARQLGAPATPTFAEALQRCDPTWREVLGPR
jgi:hypothetical protein